MTHNINKEQTTSGYISEFLNFLTVVNQHYHIALEEEKTQNDLTQDLLHHLELDDIDRNERAKVATQLSRNRKDRRVAKDKREELEALYNFINDKANKQFFDKLKSVLGDTRRTERKHQHRAYIPRVLMFDKDEENAKNI